MSDDHAAETANADIRHLAGGGGIYMAGQLAGRAIGFVLEPVFSRCLGAADYGLYAIGIACLGGLQPLASVGMPNAVQRAISINDSKGDLAASRAAMRVGGRAAALSATLIAVLLIIFADVIAGSVLHKPELAPLLRVMAFGLPLTTLGAVISEAALARRTTWPKVIGQLTMQLAGIGIFLVLWTAGSAAMGAAWSYAGKAGVAVGVIWLLSRRALNRGEANHGRSAVGLMGLLVFGFPLMLTWLAEFGLRQASVVVVGAHATAVDAGILRAALIVSLVGEMPLTALSQLFSPMIASLHAQGARERLGKLYGTAARWSLTGALPLMLFAGAQREGVLGVFGQEYRAGAAVLLLLCLGRAFSASTGSVGWLLIMSGRPWVNLTLNAVFATINISLCWVLLPRHGVVAAAAAISGAMVGVNLARLCAVWTLMRVQPYSLATLKPIIVSVALSVPLWIWPITGTLWLVLAGAAYVSASIAACAAFGLQDDDRLVLDAVRRRLNRQRGKDV